jgi:hypothetical protein
MSKVNKMTILIRHRIIYTTPVNFSLMRRMARRELRETGPTEVDGSSIIPSPLIPTNTKHIYPSTILDRISTARSREAATIIPGQLNFPNPIHVLTYLISHAFNTSTKFRGDKTYSAQPTSHHYFQCTNSNPPWLHAGHHLLCSRWYAWCFSWGRD